MKSIIILLTCVCIAVQAYSQSNTPGNASSTISIGDKSPKLRKATGWKLLTSTNGVSNENAISDTKLDVFTQNTVAQNFKWVQFVTINVNRQTLYTLLFENSIYVSPNKEEKRVNYYVMDARSYANLVRNVNEKTASNLFVHSFIHGYMSDSDGEYSQNRFLQLITNSIAAPNRNQYDFVVNALREEDKDIVRFRLPEQTQIMNAGMQNGYFQIDHATFKSLLLPVETPSNHEFDLDGPEPNSRTSQNGKAATNNDFELNDDATANQANANASPATIDANETVHDRMNKEEPITSGIVGSLTNVKGWYCNAQGKWVGENSHDYRFETVGRYEFKDFRYREKDYLVFIKHERFAGIQYFLIDKEEYRETINNMTDNALVRLRIVCHANVGSTLEEFAKKAEAVIDQPTTETIIIRRSNLVIQYKSSSSKNVSRFFIFTEDCTQYGESGDKTCNPKTSSKIKYDDAPLLLTDAMFGKMYFETSYSSFHRFFKAPLTSQIINNLPSENKYVAPSDGLGER